MPSLTDLIISALIKRGVCFEARNVDTNIDVPDTNLKVNIKIEHIKVTFTKDTDDD